MSSILIKLLSSSVKIADRSGTIVRDVMSRGDLQIVDKGCHDYQTEADRKVQGCIMASLKKKFPGLALIGEEEVDEEGKIWVEEEEDEEVWRVEDKVPSWIKDAKVEDMCVWIDPLDGTNEYTKGHLDHVTVLIGISIGGRAVAGVVHQPFYNFDSGINYDNELRSCGCNGSSSSIGSHGNKETKNQKVGRTVWGINYVGVFGLEPKVPDSSGKIIVTTRSHETPLVQKAVASCQATKVIKVGGAGFKILYLLEGNAHAYLFANRGINKWDTCAPEALLRAVGGNLTDVIGCDLDYSKNSDPGNIKGIIATAAAQDHQWYVNQIPHQVKSEI